MLAVEARPGAGSRAGRNREGGIARLALLGSGTVGQAVLDRLNQWTSTSRGEGLKLVYRGEHAARSASTRADCVRRARARGSPGLPIARSGCQSGDDRRCTRNAGVRILIDATADAAVALRHAGAAACRHPRRDGMQARYRDFADAVGRNPRRLRGARLGVRRPRDRWRGAAAAAFDPRAPGRRRPHPCDRRGDVGLSGVAVRPFRRQLSLSLRSCARRATAASPSPIRARTCRRGRAPQNPDPRPCCRVRRSTVTRSTSSRWCRRSLRSGPVQVNRASRLLDRPAGRAAARKRNFSAAACASSPALKAAARASGSRRSVRGDPLPGGGGTDNRVAIWSDRYAISRWSFRGRVPVLK